MENESYQTIKDELSKLPRETQAAIESLDWLNLVEEISLKHLLTEEETVILQKEVFLALLGLRHADALITNIEDNVGTTKEGATEIAKDLHEKIFVPVANKIEENIKEKIKNSEINFEQTVDFILSGGDYSSFVEKRKIQEPDEAEEVTKEQIQANLEKTMGTKDKFVI
jgi:hypothetical protein